MTTYYKATFLDGRVETRSTESRAYVACVDVSWRLAGAERDSGYVTWCGTRERAASEVASNHAKGRIAESADAVEITAAEYRALKAGARA